MRFIRVISAAIAITLTACDIGVDHTEPTPMPTLTPEQRVSRLCAEIDARPDHDKMVLTEDIVAWYIPCDPPLNIPLYHDYVMIFHMPSASWVLPLAWSPSRNSWTRLRDYEYNSDEARRQLEQVLADTALYERVLERASTAVRCPDAIG